MKRPMMPDISIFQIQMFIKVAEELNFSRAADIMNVTQSALSKRISSLENAIGLRLFYRKKRPVELTPEGRVLYGHWKGICEQINDSIDQAFKCRNQKKDALTVCWFSSGNMLGALSLVGRQLAQCNSGLAFRLVYSSFGKWRTLLAKNEIDIMITIRMEANRLSDELTWDEIVLCPKLICMLDINPLSKKKKIRYEDLRDQKFVILSPIETPVYQEYVRGICNRHGFEPKVSRYVSNANSLISNIEDDNDVLVCDRFLRNIDSPVIKSFELPETYSGLIAVWKKENTNPYILDFVTLLKQYYAASPPMNF